MENLVTAVESIMGGVGAVFTSAIGWVGQVGTTILETPLLFIGVVGVPLVGLAIGIFKRIFGR